MIISYFSSSGLQRSNWLLDVGAYLEMDSWFFDSWSLQMFPFMALDQAGKVTSIWVCSKMGYTVIYPQTTMWMGKMMIITSRFRGTLFSDKSISYLRNQSPWLGPYRNHREMAGWFWLLWTQSVLVKWCFCLSGWITTGCFWKWVMGICQL